MAKLMGKEITIFFVKLCIYQLAYAAITPQDTSYTAEKGKDFNIPWSYDNEANMKTVDWTYKSSLTATPTTIMSKVGTAAETVFNNYNVERVNNGDNGDIRLKSVTIDNAGIYYCEVNYDLSSGHAAVTGTVTLSVTDCKCECVCKCGIFVGLSMTFGILGALGLLIIVVGIEKGRFEKKKTVLVSDGIGIACDVISLLLNIVVLAKKYCQASENFEDSECCEEDCCKDWKYYAVIVLIVMNIAVGVTSVVIFVLAKSEKIKLDRKGITKEDLRPWEEIVREKLLHELESAYPNILSVKDLIRKVDAEESVVMEQLEELRRRDLIRQLDSGGFVRHHLDVKTAYKAKEAKEPGENDRMMETSN